MKLNRSIDAWEKCDAAAMSTMSEAAIEYAFDDAKQDIKKLASGHAQLVAALQEYKRLYEAVQPAGGWQGVYELGCDALAAAGETA